jgi:hypothetical protein
MDMETPHGKWIAEAQAIFLNMFNVCSAPSANRKWSFLGLLTKKQAEVIRRQTDLPIHVKTRWANPLQPRPI